MELLPLRRELKVRGAVQAEGHLFARGAVGKMLITTLFLSPLMPNGMGTIG